MAEYKQSMMYHDYGQVLQSSNVDCPTYVPLP